MSEATVTEPARQAGGEGTSSRRDVGRSMGAFAIAQVSVRLIGLAVLVAVARLLPTEDFGRYSVALALSAMLALPVESGMGGYLVREGTQHPDRLGVVLGHVLVLQVLLGLVAVAISALVGVLLGYDPETLTTTMLLTTAAVVVVVTRSQMSVLVSLKQARPYAMFTSAQAFVLAVLTFAAAVLDGGPVGLGAAALTTALVSFPAGQLLLRRRWSARVRFQREGLRGTLAVSSAYAASKLGIAVVTYIDAVMVQAISGNAAAAQYGAAYRLNLALRMFPQIYSDSLSQPIARLARVDRVRLVELFNRAASQLFMLGFPIAVGGYLLAEPLVTTIFGARYADAAPVAGVLMLTLMVDFPRQAVTLTALAVGLERRIAAAYLLTIIVNVSANAVLIPPYGPMGAAIAMVLSVPVFNLFTAHQLRKAGVALRIDLRWAKAVAAGATMAAVVVLSAGLPLVVRVGAGAAVYTAMLVVLRTLDAADLEMLPGGRRLGWLVSSRGPR